MGLDNLKVDQLIQAASLSYRLDTHTDVIFKLVQALLDGRQRHAFFVNGHSSSISRTELHTFSKSNCSRLSDCVFLGAFHHSNESIYAEQALFIRFACCAGIRPKIQHWDTVQNSILVRKISLVLLTDNVKEYSFHDIRICLRHQITSLRIHFSRITNVNILDTNILVLENSLLCMNQFLKVLKFLLALSPLKDPFSNGTIKHRTNAPIFVASALSCIVKHGPQNTVPFDFEGELELLGPGGQDRHWQRSTFFLLLSHVRYRQVMDQYLFYGPS
mmetsp:Transcript_12536/g.21396  ORF Transcript_12536/g.21396 Transcript_12536/m.21396 type:complete len:274 (-) Transcript_12536:1072-1893(-)